jgi:hypothetical protein
MPKDLAQATFQIHEQTDSNPKYKIQTMQGTNTYMKEWFSKAIFIFHLNERI